MPDPQSTEWGGLSWSDWYAFEQAVEEHLIPKSGGIYRFQSAGEPGLLYIGEGANRRRRLRILARAYKAHPASYYLDWPAGTKRPHRGHYAAPYLRLCEDARCVIEVSWAKNVHADRVVRRAIEQSLIQQYLADTGGAPPCQHGGQGVDAYLAERKHSR
jgi:hypothetical protein